jgi:transcriptional regulator with XRE-family HTH domain
MAIMLDRVFEEAGATQQQVAEACGVTIQTVKRWSRGIARPHSRLVPKLVAYLGIPPQCLRPDLWKPEP